MEISAINHNNVELPINLTSKVTPWVSSDSLKVSPIKNLVFDALTKRVSEVDHEVCDAGAEDSFFVCDLGEVYRSYQKWKRALPLVHPHYAIKCNANQSLIRLLGKLGANFDCASKNEIDFILKLGFLPDRIVYANPCKTNSFIRHARVSEVNLTTIDNSEELHKLKKYHPSCKILIRVATDDETALCRLSTKFGCTLDSALNELLPLAKELNLDVRGVAFHIGSGARDFGSLYKAIQECRVIFDKGIETYGFQMETLDIGGGFEDETFEKSSAVVKMSLEKFFPESYTSLNNIKFIAEPGRFFASNAFTLATHVIAKREAPASLRATSDTDAMIYINDGVYGNLNCILFDHQHPTPCVLTHNGEVITEEDVDEKKGKFVSIWGPTCDGLDCVSNKTFLPRDVAIGDWVYFPNLGAYTSAASTSFNGFPSMSDIIYVSSEDLSEIGFYI